MNETRNSIRATTAVRDAEIFENSLCVWWKWSVKQVSYGLGLKSEEAVDNQIGENGKTKLWQMTAKVLRGVAR